MKTKTSELTGAALDWAVAQALGYTTSTLDLLYDIKSYDQFHPSTDWSHGGPIIEEEGISISYWGTKSKFGQHSRPEQFWEARHPSHRTYSYRTVGFGSAPLVAAMRCFVTRKLGSKVKVPDGLL